MGADELYEAPRGRATGALAAAALGLALAWAPLALSEGCATPGEGADRGPALGGGETEGDVLRTLGKPDRVYEAKDEKTGRKRTIWVYERVTDVNGSKSIRKVVLQDGRVVEDEDLSSPHTAVTPDIPPDRTTQRDKDW